VNHVSI